MGRHIRFFISHFGKKAIHQSSLDTLNQIWQCGRGMLSAREEGKVHEPMQTADNSCLTSLAWLLWDLQWRERKVSKLCKSIRGEGESFTEAAWTQVAVSSLLRGSELCYIKGPEIRQCEYPGTRVWKRHQSGSTAPAKPQCKGDLAEAGLGDWL